MAMRYLPHLLEFFIAGISLLFLFLQIMQKREIKNRPWSRRLHSKLKARKIELFLLGSLCLVARLMIGVLSPVDIPMVQRTQTRGEVIEKADIHTLDRELADGQAGART